METDCVCIRTRHTLRTFNKRLELLKEEKYVCKRREKQNSFLHYLNLVNIKKLMCPDSLKFEKELGEIFGLL